MVSAIIALLAVTNLIVATHADQHYTHITNLLPDLEICSRKVEFTRGCLAQSINSMEGYLDKGIPELGIPSLNPLYLDPFVLTSAKIFKGNITVSNIIIQGLPYYWVKHGGVSPNMRKVNFEVRFEGPIMDADFEINGTFKSKPLNKQCKLTTEFLGYTAAVAISGELYTENNVEQSEHFRVDNVLVKLSRGYVEFNESDFDFEEETDCPIIPYLNRSWKNEIEPHLRPIVEKMAADGIHKIASQIYSSFPINILMPN